MKKRMFRSVVCTIAVLAMVLASLPDTAYAADIHVNDGSMGYTADNKQEDILKNDILTGDKTAGNEDAAARQTPGNEAVIPEKDRLMEENTARTAEIDELLTENTVGTDDPVSGKPAEDYKFSPDAGIEDAGLKDAGLEDSLYENTRFEEAMHEENRLGEPKPEAPLAEDPLLEEDEPGRDGYVYPKETTYHITFLIMSNGVQKKLVYNNTATASNSRITDVLSNAEINNIFMQTMGSSNEIEGWKIEKDGKFYMGIPNRDDIATESFIEPKSDYCITAYLKNHVTDAGGLRVEAIPTVTYNGRSHVCKGQTLKDGQLKSMSNDLGIYVYDETDTLLRLGTDYKVSYKNNKEASMYMVFEGGEVTYRPKYQSEKDDKKRPCVIITGQGTYSGFSTTVYFDILPYNFGDPYGSDPLVTVSGLKHSYKMSGGKVKDPAPTVTLQHPQAGKIKLKSGTDYVPKYYKYEGSKWIEHTAIDEGGEWLYAIEGRGSYCGVYFGQDSGATFNDGSQPGIVNPTVAYYSTSEYKNCQFKVYSIIDRDLANAKITIKKKKVPYKPGVYYSPEDLGIKVTLGDSVLKVGTDINIVFDGADYMRVNQASKDIAGRVYYMMTDNAEFTNQIWMANEYKIRIEAVDYNTEGYYGSLDSSKKVTLEGISVNKKWFSLSNPKLKYDGTYSMGGTFGISGDPKVKPLQDTMYSSDIDDLIPAMYRSEFTVDGKTYYQYNYLAAMKAIHDKGYSYDQLRDYYGVHPSSTYAKTPGTYSTVLYPFGPGVNHDSQTSITYKRDAISLKDAWDAGLVKVTCSSECYYNAGGAIPKVIYIKMYDKEGHEATKSYNMRYNGRKCKGTDGDPIDPATADFTITAVNNTAPGTGYLTINCTGNAYSGTLKKKVAYTIKPCPVTGTIQVLNSSDYAISYGERTETLKVSSLDDAGKLYAVMSPVKGSLGTTPPSKPAITLYQSYFRNEEECNDLRVALKAIDPKKYKPVLSLNSPAHGYDVNISGAGDPGKTGYDFSASPKLSAVYDVYDEEVTVVSVIATYGTDTYDLIKDKKVTLPYTGSQIKFDSISVKAAKKDGTVLDMAPADYDVIYGSNIAAGSNTGSVTIVFKKNVNKFDFGSPSKTCKFSIKAAPAGKL